LISSNTSSRKAFDNLVFNIVLLRFVNWITDSGRRFITIIVNRKPARFTASINRTPNLPDIIQALKQIDGIDIG
jgi:hypothetical protein